jgi:hypothetical protein
MNGEKGAASAPDWAANRGRKARAIENRSLSTPTDELAQQPRLAVYDGQRCLGHILGRGKLGHEAFDADHKSIGVFSSVKFAANALSEREGER